MFFPLLQRHSFVSSAAFLGGTFGDRSSVLEFSKINTRNMYVF